RPTDIALSQTTVLENSSAGTVVGLLTASDPDTSDSFSYTLLSNPGNLFAIDGANLVVVGQLDYETESSHNVTIRVTDSVNNTFDKTFTIGVMNANDAPTLVNSIPDQFALEDRTWNYQLPANTFFDQDNNALSYSATLADGTALPTWLTFDGN